MLTKENIKQIYQLTPLQEGMFFHSLLEYEYNVYFAQMSYSIHSELNVDLVEKSFNELFNRYDILRTVFIQKTTERPLQVVLKERCCKLVYEDISGLENKAKYLKDFKEVDARKTFDLSKDVLMRITIFKLAEKEFEFIWTHHHILMDGWCIGILVNEFYQLYFGLINNTPCILPPVTPYSEYIQWLERQNIESAEAYWSSYISDYSKNTPVPAPIRNPEHWKNYINAEVVLNFPPDIAEEIRNRAGKKQVTVNNYFQTIWGILLSKYNNVQDVAFGTVISGRPPEIHNISEMVGLFINTIPVRIKYHTGDTFSDLLMLTQEKAMLSKSYDHFSLSSVQSFSSLKAELFDHIVVFENFPVAENINKDSTDDTASAISNVKIVERTHYNFNVIVLPHDGLTVKFDFNEVYYCREHVEQIAQSLFYLFEQVLKNENCCIDDLLLTETQEIFVQHRNYWWNQFLGEIPVLDFPLDKPRSLIKSNKVNVINKKLGKGLGKSINTLVEEEGATLFMGLLSAVNILLYKYTGQKDIVIGNPIAGRNQVEVENRFGLYANTLALRNSFIDSDSFIEVLQKVKQTTISAYQHQSYSFDELIDLLDMKSNNGRNHLFDVMMILESTDENSDDEHLIQVNVKGCNELENFRKSDLTFAFKDIGGEIHLSIEYSTDLFHKETIVRLSDHLERLLNTIVNKSEEKISCLDYLSPEEKHELLFTFNDTTVEYPKDKTIVDLFDEQVKKTPDNVAIVFEKKELTYRELNERSNQLAHYLQKNYAIKPDDLVGIKQERSEWMIVSILGILKSGGAYVPIDPEYPQERIDYIEKDTKCKVCLDENELNNFKRDQKKYSKKKTTSPAKPDNLAYVIYTSGSTGQPKGVMVEHCSLFDYICTFVEKFKISKADKCIQQASFSFDTHLEEVYPVLIKGGSILITKNGGRDIGELRQLIQQKQVTVLSTTPFVLNELNAQGPDIASLRILISGGDMLNVSHIDYFIGKLKIYNSYGPSESTVCSTYHKIEESSSPSLIGKPINNRNVYIVNSHNLLMSKGVIGEICIGGAGLARGYLNQKELTAEKFIASPFKEGERLYKTGDLGRWLPDGNIEFIGRKDDQVKIRGYRIELGEIEHALLKNKQIAAAVVLCKSNEQGEKELVAYITSQTEQKTSELRSYLKEILPEYMLPAYYVQLKELPLTGNGKIDKKSLPDPEGLGLSSGIEYVPPRNGLDSRLVSIWGKLLNVTTDKISLKDDFFDLGGQSIKAIRLLSGIYKEFGVKMGLKFVFNNLTVEEQSNSLHKILSGDAAIDDNSIITLSPIEPDKLNLFFIPPIIGSSSVFKKLAVKLSPIANSYGLQYKGFDKDTILDKNIEEMALNFVHEITAIQNNGTFYILGYSMGAIVAYEIVKQLEKNKMHCTLILIDAEVSNVKTKHTDKEVEKMLARELNEWYKELMPEDKNHMKKFITNNINMFSEYIISTKVDADILAFQASKNLFPANMKQWSSYTSGKLRVQKIDSDHYNILSEKHLEKLSSEICFFMKSDKELTV